MHSFVHSKKLLAAALALSLAACANMNTPVASGASSAYPPAATAGSAYVRYGVVQSIELVPMNNSTSGGIGVGTVAGALVGGILGNTLLDVRESLKHGEVVWDDQGVPNGEIRIWVDLRRQTISVYRSDHEIGTALIAYGTDEKETPSGSFKILSKHRYYRSRTYAAEMPYSLFITLDGIALHSSPLRSGYATHGCIGLPEQFARQLFELAGIGTTVDIGRSSTALRRQLTN